MHSASCVVVCSFALTAAPIAFVACTSRFSRRRAFRARFFAVFTAARSASSSSDDIPPAPAPAG